MDTTRRLDALLARHLFGLDASYRMVTKDKDRLLWDWTRPDLPMIQMWVVPGDPGDYCELDHYSTTYAGMGMVIEAMRGRKCQLELASFGLVGMYPPWRARFLGRTSSEAFEWAAPLAVALAAARVVCPEELGKLEEDDD